MYDHLAHLNKIYYNYLNLAHYFIKWVGPLNGLYKKIFKKNLNHEDSTDSTAL